MTRLLPTLVVFGLLGGSVAAFAVTERLKLERSPITGTRISTSFSPTCGCPTREATIAFRLRKPDTVSATVLDSDGDQVAAIASDLHAPKGFLTLRWDGRNESGAIVPQGGYRVRVHLARRHESITLPNTIQVDMSAPQITLTAIQPHRFSPEGDGRRDRVAIRFRVSEEARPLLLVNGKRAIRGRLTQGSGVLYWAGRLRGRTLPAGRYLLTLRAQDVAGNRSAPSRPHPVEIRYLVVGGSAFAPSIARVPPGRLFFIRVDSDARRVAWRLDGESGFVRPGKVHIRAPNRRGRYRLVFDDRGHRASVRVIVRKP